jgi:hypothetical protein
MQARERPAVSSKRRHRRKACTGKVRHRDPAAARAAANAARGRGHRVNAYPCPHCGGWHIGHPTRGQRHAARQAVSARRRVHRQVT